MQLLHFTVVAGVAVPLYFPHFAVTILSMGNEQSSQGSSRQAGKDILKQVDIDHPILTTSGWAFYHAQSLPPHEPSLSLSLFISQNNAEDLEGIGKHLRSLRHPNVLRFIDGFQQDSSSNPYVLVTERVLPLSLSLKQQSPLQIRLGLQKIVQALDFLANVAKITGQIDINKDSIFITSQGNWKLLVHETKQSDKKSFDSLIKDLFADQPDDVESLDFQSFIESETEMNHEKILSHPYFSSNIYVEIENFLGHLAIKREENKSIFFASLTSKLKENIPEELIAKQLTPLLLARMVLLDPNANQNFLPHFLSAKPDDDNEDSDNSILSPSLFKEYVVPILTNIFHVRDTQIRLVLLKFLPKYIQMFSTSQLEDLLPLILLGMRDSNDQVVSETLKAIALLVPILGATKVVGKNRRKIFADGSPSKVKTKEDIRDNDHITHRLQELRQSPIGAETSDEEWEPWQEDLEVEKVTENDILELDNNCEEATGDNFFADMEPVIQHTTKVCVQKDKFALQVDWNDVDDEAWS